MSRRIPENLLRARPQDYILCAALLCASVLWLAAPSGAGDAGAGTARLLRDGAGAGELPLDRPASLTLALPTGPVTVEVVPGKGIHIADTNCPRKTCRHQGWARRPGETIVCLPNRLVIEIEGEEGGYDAVVR